MTSRWTVATVLAAANQYLTEKSLSRGPAEKFGGRSKLENAALGGASRARLEAELLLAHSLNLSRFDLYTQFDRPLSDDEREAFRDLIRRRSQGQPVQRLTGSQAFRHLNLTMAPGVFIPRPETELLVERVLERVDSQAESAVLELGTGSGAICVSLALEASHLRVWTVDISDRALALAQTNAAAHGVENRIDFRRGDLFDAVPSGERFAGIVANPPYIPTAEIDDLETHVRDHEPRAALDGGLTGLDFYKRIIAQAPAYLRPGGFVAFEVGQGQADAVAKMLDMGGFGSTKVHQDYAGIDRMVTADIHSD